MYYHFKRKIRGKICYNAVTFPGYYTRNTMNDLLKCIDNNIVFKLVIILHLNGTIYTNVAVLKGQQHVSTIHTTGIRSWQHGGTKVEDGNFIPRRRTGSRSAAITTGDTVFLSSTDRDLLSDVDYACARTCVHKHGLTSRHTLVHNA